MLPKPFFKLQLGWLANIRGALKIMSDAQQFDIWDSSYNLVQLLR